MPGNVYYPPTRCEFTVSFRNLLNLSLFMFLYRAFFFDFTLANLPIIGIGFYGTYSLLIDIKQVRLVTRCSLLHIVPRKKSADCRQCRDF